MEHNFSEKQIRYAELVGREKLYVLLDKEKFESIPLTIRSYATDAPDELLDSMSFVFNGQNGPLYIFSSEAAFMNGAVKLRSEGGRGREYRNFRVRPSRLFDRAVKLQTKDICVDYGQPYSFTIKLTDLHEVARLSSVAALALLEKIFVLQGKGGFVMPLEIDSKNYVVGFINAMDADDLIAKLGSERSQSRVEGNNIRKLAKNLLESDFAGLLMNPGTDAEFILDKEELRYLLLCVDVICASKPGTWEILRGLFGKK